MAIERRDRVKDSTTTTGTGTVTLTGTAPDGFRSFTAAHTDGATVRYAISLGTEWEVGEGVFTTSGNTLTRATVLASSNSGSLVSFSAGTKTVISTLTASEADGWLLTTQLESFRNRLINPRGEVYQRAVAATADDTYFADRWYALTQTGTITPSVLSEPEDGYPVGIRLTQSQASAQRFGFAQIIEGKNCKDMRGGSGILVPRIRASASQAIRYAILGWTGTEDAVTSDVVNDWTSGTYTAGNFFLASSLSVIAVGSQTLSANTWTSLTALTAALGSTFKNIIVMVWTEGTAAQNFTLDFDFVQFEKGAIATPFEFRDYGRELGLCYRYYYKLGGTGALYMLPTDGQRVSGNLIDGFINSPVSMRVAPTFEHSSPSYVGSFPSGNQIGFYNNWTPGYATISGSLTLSYGASEPGGGLFRATAGTSFSGTSGNTGHWYFGSSAYIAAVADL